MKNIILLLASIWLSNIVFGQATQLYCDFESACNIIRIDTNLTDNLWQIGHTDKPGFTFETNCLATDTTSPYLPNNYSVFSVKIPRAPWDMWIDVQFYHIVDTDEGLDGGYIEISSDNGQTWDNLINSQLLDWQQNLYSDTNLLFDGTPGFSGSDYSSWPTSFGLWVMDELDTLNLRFVFISDSIDQHRSGWCIDELGFWGVWEGIGENHNDFYFDIFPNPCTDELTIRYAISDIRNSKFEVIDISGRVMKSIEQTTGVDHQTIDVSELPIGMYFIRMQSEDNVSMRKIVKQ